MSYIKSGLPFKAQNMPKIHTYPEEWKKLDKIADKLEEKLDLLRSYEWRGSRVGNVPLTEETRAIVKELSKIDAQMHSILMTANPEYFNYWYN